MTGPGRILCHGCYEDLGGEWDPETDTYVYECRACAGVDGPLTIEIRADRRATRGGRAATGIMAELGVYDGLKEALASEPGRWLEFGVVEHLYAQANPRAFRELVERYGHVAFGPDTNTASWMLGRALWTLQREGEVFVTRHAGTGRWDYLRDGNAWSLPPAPGEAEVLSWASYCDREGFHAWTCPAIDWRDTPNAAGEATRNGGTPQAP